MELKLVRAAKKPKYTIGHLYRKDKQNGQWIFICDTIEDKDRGLDQNMTEANILKIKVKHQTAIPTGRYEIIKNVVSATFVKKPKYKALNGGRLPRFKYVKGFDGILMHAGVDQDSSSGCVIVGENKVVGKVINSWETYVKVDNMIEKAIDRGERVFITVM
jgi:hypothetical protein